MKLYLIQNKEGKFFRAIGYGGQGGNWVEMDKAKFYSKIGQAKSRVTFYAKAYPKYGMPKILEFDLDINAAKFIDVKEETIGKIQNAKRQLVKRQDVRQSYGSSMTNYYQGKIDEIDKSLNILQNG